MQKLTLIYFLFLYFAMQAQEYTFVIVDVETLNPIPFANIQFGSGQGTISNEEGVFRLNLEQLKSSEIQITCLGYRPQTIAINTLLSGSEMITMQPESIELNEVQIGGAIPSVAEIIRIAKANLAQNYGNTEIPYQLFYREASGMELHEINFELDKDSEINRTEKEQVNRQLQELGADLKRANYRTYFDINGAVGIGKDTVLPYEISGVYQLTDHKGGFDLEQLQNRAKTLISKHLDGTTTYALKSGIFKLEDSLKTQSTVETSEVTDSLSVKALTQKMNTPIGIATWNKNSRFVSFLNPKLYNHKWENTTYFDGNYVYAISFNPRSGKSNYSGMLFIDANSFAILKVQYGYATGKSGKKVNFKFLLGIKFEEDLSSGTVIYRKNPLSDKYHPFIIQENAGSSFYLHRNLKFIANSKNPRRLKFDMLLDANYRQSTSVWLQPTKKTQKKVLEMVKFPIIKSDRFNPNFHRQKQAMEPIEAMKQFGIPQN
jgi:hypothetical protein